MKQIGDVSFLFDQMHSKTCSSHWVGGDHTSSSSSSSFYLFHPFPKNATSRGFCRHGDPCRSPTAQKSRRAEGGCNLSQMIPRILWNVKWSEELRSSLQFAIKRLRLYSTSLTWTENKLLEKKIRASEGWKIQYTKVLSWHKLLIGNIQH